jgi:hypothetical protein
VYDCSHDQLKTQTINLTAPKDCKDTTTDYYPVRMTQIKIIMTDGDRPIMATQCLVLRTQEVVRCGGHPSFHYGSVKIAINQPVEVTPQECRDALIAGKISVQGQRMDFKVGVSHFHRAVNGDCAITTFTRKGVMYEKSTRRQSSRSSFPRSEASSWTTPSSSPACSLPLMRMALSEMCTTGCWSGVQKYFHAKILCP